MNISSINTSTSANMLRSLNSEGAKRPQGPPPDPAKMLEEISSQFIKDSDKDGDGALSSSEVSGLSSDAFKTLDADGDGKLTQTEIKDAASQQMEAMRQEFETNGPEAAKAKMEALKDTPAGQLMQLMMPKPPEGGMRPEGASTSDTGSNTEVWRSVYNENRSAASYFATQGSQLDLNG